MTKAITYAVGYTICYQCASKFWKACRQLEASTTVLIFACLANQVTR